jgi:hypothetical protein
MTGQLEMSSFGMIWKEKAITSVNTEDYFFLIIIMSSTSCFVCPLLQ